MPVAGIVAEYNPFHTGHAYHIARTRQLLGEDTGIVAVMSGNWVQRGECALGDKWTRARMALVGGADLVLELPTVWAASSAEGFARGAVALLAACGVVDVLSFGSEEGRTEPLEALARCMNGPAYAGALREELLPGRSFPLCRRAAAARLLGEETARLLDGPNNSLGVEYLRFLPPHMKALTVKRRGAGHDGGEEGGFASASRLRRWLLDGEEERARPYLPIPWPGETARLDRCTGAILARLRTMTLEECLALPDSGDGLAQRLLAAARQAGDLEELYRLTKTRGFAHARARRLVLYAFLGIREADRPPAPLYLRVLAFNSRGQALLKEMRARARLPVLVKPAHIRRPEFSPRARALFALEERCTDLFALCYPTPRPAGLERRRSPAVITSPEAGEEREI